MPDAVHLVEAPVDDPLVGNSHQRRPPGRRESLDAGEGVVPRFASMRHGDLAVRLVDLGLTDDDLVPEQFEDSVRRRGLEWHDHPLRSTSWRAFRPSPLYRAD